MESMPNEILQKIFHHVGLLDQVDSLALVCWRWRFLVLAEPPSDKELKDFRDLLINDERMSTTEHPLHLLHQQPSQKSTWSPKDTTIITEKWKTVVRVLLFYRRYPMVKDVLRREIHPAIFVGAQYLDDLVGKQAILEINQIPWPVDIAAPPWEYLGEEESMSIVANGVLCWVECVHNWCVLVALSWQEHQWSFFHNSMPQPSLMADAICQQTFAGLERALKVLENHFLCESRPRLFHEAPGHIVREHFIHSDAKEARLYTDVTRTWIVLTMRHMDFLHAANRRDSSSRTHGWKEIYERAESCVVKTMSHELCQDPDIPYVCSIRTCPRFRRHLVRTKPRELP